MPQRFIKSRSLVLAALSALAAMVATVSSVLADSGGASFP
jgi:hypothetical protein